MAQWHKPNHRITVVRQLQLPANLRPRRARIFDLATRLGTIAVRDQIVRGALLADRMPGWLNRRFGTAVPPKPVLVVGGGACGMTTAVRLADQNIPIVLAERGDVPFIAQAECDSRWLHPTQYDWPMDHWPKQRFPWLVKTSHTVPFPFCAGIASSVVNNHWVPSLARHRRRLNDQIKFRFNRIARNIKPRRDKLIEAEFFDATTNKSLQHRLFSAIVWATRFGDEKCFVEGSAAFRGIPFWQTDGFERNGWGVPGDDGAPRTVVISGSGDGALQDFLRIVRRLHRQALPKSQWARRGS